MTITYQHSAHRGIEKPLTMYKKTLFWRKRKRLSACWGQCVTLIIFYFLNIHTHMSMGGTSRAFVVMSHGCAATFRVKVPSHTHTGEKIHHHTLNSSLTYKSLISFILFNTNGFMWETERSSLSLKPLKLFPALCKHSDTNVSHICISVNSSEACDSSCMFSWFYSVVSCWSRMCRLSAVSWTGNRDGGFIHAHRDFIKATSDKQHGDKHGITVWKALR